LFIASPSVIELQ